MSTTKRSLTRIERTAYHEAGHAVAGIELKRAFRYVTIIPDRKNGSLGQVFRPTVPEWFDPELNLTRRAKSYVEREVLTGLSGAAAVSIASGRETVRAGRKGAGEDFRAASNLASYVYPNYEVLTAYLEFAFVEALQRLKEKRVWEAVEAMTKALLREKRLSYQEAKAVWGESNKRGCPPLKWSRPSATSDGTGIATGTDEGAVQVPGEEPRLVETERARQGAL